MRELRNLGSRPVCAIGPAAAGRAPTEIEHPPGEEDWLELRDTPCGEPAFLLLGVLSHSGACAAPSASRRPAASLPRAVHRVPVALGGTPRVWRTDRTATVVIAGTDRLTTAAAQAAEALAFLDR